LGFLHKKTEAEEKEELLIYAFEELNREGADYLNIYANIESAIE